MDEPDIRNLPYACGSPDEAIGGRAKQSRHVRLGLSGNYGLTLAHFVKSTGQQQTITAGSDGARSALTVMGDFLVAQDPTLPGNH